MSTQLYNNNDTLLIVRRMMTTAARVAIRGAGDVDGHRVAGAVRAHVNGDGLNLTEMRLRRRILDADTPPQPTNSEQVALGVLANARLIEPDGPGGWKASDDVTFSLGTGPDRTTA